MTKEIVRLSYAPRMLASVLAGEIAKVSCLIFFGGFLGCSSQGVTCTLEGGDGLTVVVKDSSTGNAICDAIVIAHDGAYVERFGAPFTDPSGCGGGGYHGAVGRAGTYDIEVSRTSFQTSTIHGLVLVKNECNVIPQIVTVKLARM